MQWAKAGADRREGVGFTSLLTRVRKLKVTIKRGERHPTTRGGKNEQVYIGLVPRMFALGDFGRYRRRSAGLKEWPTGAPCKKVGGQSDQVFLRQTRERYRQE